MEGSRHKEMCGDKSYLNEEEMVNFLRKKGYRIGFGDGKSVDLTKVIDYAVLEGFDVVVNSDRDFEFYKE